MQHSGIASLLLLLGAHAHEYCGSSQASDLETVFKDLARPDGLELAQVQVVTRHGARTPAAPCDAYLPAAAKLRWDSECDSGSRFVEALGEGQVSFSRRFVRGETTLGGACQVGQLIELGVRQMRALGDVLRGAYASGDESTVAALEHKAVYARSSDLSRTRATAEAVLSSFLDESTPLVTLETTDFSEDWIYPNSAKCPTLDKLASTALEKDLAFLQWNASARAALAPKLTAFFQEDWSFGDDMAGSHLLDCVLSAVCVGKAPEVFGGGRDPEGQEELVRSLTTYAERREFHKLRYDDAAYAKLVAAPLARRVLDKATTENVSLALWSAHDTTVMPFEVALGIQDTDTWAPYGHALVLEVWRDPRLGTKFLRALTAGGVKKLCAKKELCALDDLRRATASWIDADTHSCTSDNTSVLLLEEEEEPSSKRSPWLGLRRRREQRASQRTLDPTGVVVACLASVGQIALGVAIGFRVASTAAAAAATSRTTKGQPSFRRGGSALFASSSRVV